MPERDTYPDEINGVEKKLLFDTPHYKHEVETVGHRAVYEFDEYTVTIKPEYDTDASEEGDMVVDEWVVFAHEEENPLATSDELTFDSVETAIQRVEALPN
jgi:hypothetical protein